MSYPTVEPTVELPPARRAATVAGAVRNSARTATTAMIARARDRTDLPDRDMGDPRLWKTGQRRATRRGKSIAAPFVLVAGSRQGTCVVRRPRSAHRA